MPGERGPEVSMKEATEHDDEATIAQFRVSDMMATLRETGEAEGLTDDELRAKAIEVIRISEEAAEEE